MCGDANWRLRSWAARHTTPPDCRRLLQAYRHTTMPFYYALHTLLLPETAAFKEGRRNCATFLFGSVCYAAAYALVENARLRWGASFDAVKSALLMVWLADGATMAVIYRGYYGRSILCEVGEDQRHWVYDADTHKYRPRTPAEELAARLADQRAAAALQEAAAAEERAAAAAKRTAAIRTRKREIRAALTIQRWWRGRLYAPPAGLFYLRAKSRFESAVVNDGQASRSS